jgi:hypothetical protein
LLPTNGQVNAQEILAEVEAEVEAEAAEAEAAEAEAAEAEATEAAAAGAVRVQGLALARTVDGLDDHVGRAGRGHGYVRARCCGADGAC